MIQEIEGRELPRSLEAEVSVLGAALVDPDCVDKVVAGLEEDDFFLIEHKALFGAILSLFTKGKELDPVTLIEQLRSAGDLEKSGGHATIAELLEAVPSGANVDYYVEIVQDRAKLRRLIRACQTTIADAYEANGDGPRPVLEAAERRIYSIMNRHDVKGGFRSAKSAVFGAMQLIEEEAAASGGVTGVPTGVPSIDRMTTGLHPGGMTILAARPSMGKSALMWQMATHAASHGYVAAVCSLEMSEDELVKRGLAQRAGIDLMDLRRGDLSKEAWEELSAAANWITQIPLKLDDTTSVTVPEIRAKVRRLKSAEGLDVLFVDYLQLMTGDGDNRTNQVGSISRGLKLMAREFDIHVVALSQLSRAVEHRSPPRPILSDLRDSGAIEQDADNVLMLWRPEYYFDKKTPDDLWAEWQDAGEIIIAKQRNGPLGRVKLRWNRKVITFTEYARKQEEERAEEHADLMPFAS